MSKARIFRTLIIGSLSFALVGAAASFGASSAQADLATGEHGVTVVPSTPTDYGSAEFEQSLKNLKADGANYVDFDIPYYQSDATSTDIGPGYNTPTNQALIAGVTYAHSLGLKVEFAIYLDLDNGVWRANINPTGAARAIWFQNYNNLLVEYGKIAQEEGVEQYCLGVEMSRVTSFKTNPDNTQEWDTMIANVRQVYSGALLYDVNHLDGVHDYVKFWNKLDYIGISAYWGFSGDDSVANLESQWQTINQDTIEPLFKEWGKPIIFTEIGYRSVTGAHTEPWNYSLTGAYDPQEQVNDYTALLQYWSNQPDMDGVFWWWWSPDPEYGGSGNTDFTPQNKPAEQVLQKFWLNNSSGGSGSGSGGQGQGGSGSGGGSGSSGSGGKGSSGSGTTGGGQGSGSGGSGSSGGGSGSGKGSGGSTASAAALLKIREEIAAAVKHTKFPVSTATRGDSMARIATP